MKHVKLQPLFVAGLIGLTASAHSVNVFLLSSGDAGQDNGTIATLTSFGHNVTLGPTQNLFTGSGLAGQQVILLEPNYNWTAGDIPVSGQNAIVSFVSAGGGLVTSAWTEYLMAGGQYAILNPIMPVDPTLSYNLNTQATFSKVTSNAILNAGVSSSFTFNLQNVSGTESNIGPVRTGASEFYHSTISGVTGLAGWYYGSGSGRVLSWSETNGIAQWNSTDAARLFSNSMNWAAAPPVPEPATLAVLGIGALIALRRRRHF